MTTLPEKENELVVQNTNLQPVEPSDDRSAWQAFVDALRTTIGLKPIYLAERWSTAKVRQEEADADAKLLEARAKFEIAAAEAQRIRLEAEGNYEKDMAIAQYIRTQSSGESDAGSLVQRMIDASSKSTDECANDVIAIIEEIRLLGGTVEVEDRSKTPIARAQDSSTR